MGGIRDIQALMKASVIKPLKRAGGWCEPVWYIAFPLSELPVKAGRMVPFIVPSSGHCICIGNLGGNTVYTVPFLWGVFYLFRHNKYQEAE